ncbi:MAG: hypothetical protein ACMG6E_07380 [Candidatus Roizmanbacteria bacterium]
MEDHFPPVEGHPDLIIVSLGYPAPHLSSGRLLEVLGDLLPPRKVLSNPLIGHCTQAFTCSLGVFKLLVVLYFLYFIAKVINHWCLSFIQLVMDSIVLLHFLIMLQCIKALLDHTGVY